MAHQSQQFLEAIHELSSLLISEESLETVLERVAKLVTSAVDGADATGITVVTEGGHKIDGFRAETAASSEPKVMELDAAQYEAKEGPCLEAIMRREILVIDDLETDERWPGFRKKALAIGLKSSLSVPIVAGEGALGALSIYAFHAHAFQDAGIETAKMFAAQAAITVSNMQAFVGAVQQSDNLAKAMESRAAIEQAKGMIMMQRRCGPDEAFQTLVAASQARNKKLRDIAQEIVDAAAGGDLERSISGH